MSHPYVGKSDAAVITEAANMLRERSGSLPERQRALLILAIMHADAESLPEIIEEMTLRVYARERERCRYLASRSWERSVEGARQRRLDVLEHLERWERAEIAV